MTDAEDVILIKAFRIISEVAMPLTDKKEDALDALKRLAGLDREVTLMLINQGLEATKGLTEEPIETCAFFMLLGAILAIDHERRSRVISIERAKRALPDYVDRDPSLPQYEDGGTCPKCGGSWVGSPTCPKCETTQVSEPASKGGQ